MITNEALTLAATEAAKALVAAAEALEDCGEQYLPTPERERKLRLREKWYGFRRAAAACLVAALGLTGWLTVDAQARETFTGWVREVYDTYVTYRDPDYTEETPLPDKDQHYRLGWVPEGYTEVRRSERKNIVMTTYADQQGRYLSFRYSWGENSLLLLGDTDRMTCSYASVSGIPADLWTSDDPDISSALTWTDESGTNFFLSGFLDEDSLLRLAESIEVE